MQVDPGVLLRTLRVEYRAACEASNEIIRSIGDADAAVLYNGHVRNLRWVMLGVIQETASHAGHADIIREQIDGKTGREPITDRRRVARRSGPLTACPRSPDVCRR